MVFGKLADTTGWRPVILAGVAIFVIGSALAGIAPNMAVLIAGRLVQGASAGAILPATLTLVADLYPAHRRGRAQGWLASVWAGVAVTGPLLGAFITNWSSWRWIFWLSLPIGLAAAVGFALLLPRDESRGRGETDVVGAALFTGCVGLLMIGLTDMKVAAAARIALSLLASAVLGVAFLRHERRTPEPIIPFKLWRRRAVALTNGAALVTGIALMGGDDLSARLRTGASAPLAAYRRLRAHAADARLGGRRDRGGEAVPAPGSAPRAR